MSSSLPLQRSESNDVKLLRNQVSGRQDQRERVREDIGCDIYRAGLDTSILQDMREFGL